MSPTNVVAENVKVFMRLRNFRQEDLAERMTLIGVGFDKGGGGKTGWYRRTVGKMLGMDRRIDIDELFGLAVVLETTVGALMSPHVDGVIDFDAEYVIADLEPLGVSDFEILLHDLPDGQTRPRLVLSGLPTRTETPGELHWVKKLNESEQAMANAMTAFKLAHPDIDMDTASANEVLSIIQQDKKGDGTED